MKKKKSLFQKFLSFVERVGNKLPNPVLLFVILAFSVIVLSFIFSLFDASVINPDTGEEEAIINMISAEGLEHILTSMLANFTGFAPLGLILSMMIGIGLAEKVGLIDYVIRKTLLKAPSYLITYAVVFIGVLGNLASDAAVVIVPPLAALVFYKVGRHPLAGVAAGFAGAASGFTANLFIAGTDALLSGISTEAAQIIDKTAVVTPVDNWYFNSISVFMITIVAGIVTTKIVEPRLGKYTGEVIDEEEDIPNAKKGFFAALFAGIGYLLLIAVAIAFPNSPLRGEDGGIINSPFMDGIVPIILIFFLVIGLAFGITVGKIKSSHDANYYMVEAIKSMSGFIVMAFAMSQFINYFQWSNIGTWLAINGSDFLQSIQFTGFGLVIGYIIFTALLNFFIPGGAEKWVLESPVLVPIFMKLGYSPGFAQVAYRIGDSSMNVITPLSPYLAMVLPVIQKYDKKASIGTYISLMIPYAIAILISWIILISIFFFFDLPYGPGVHTYM